MSRAAKFFWIFIVGVGAAVLVSYVSGYWLEYMSTLAAFSLVAAIAGAITEKNVDAAGIFTLALGIAVAVIFWKLYDNEGVLTANFCTAVIWACLNSQPTTLASSSKPHAVHKSPGY